MHRQVDIENAIRRFRLGLGPVRPGDPTVIDQHYLGTETTLLGIAAWMSLFCVGLRSCNLTYPSARRCAIRLQIRILAFRPASFQTSLGDRHIHLFGRVRELPFRCAAAREIADKLR